MAKDEDRYLDIDTGNLHEEWGRQPKLYRRAARRLAEARRALDTAKSRLDVEEADCEREVRERPADFGIKKVTESAIKAAVVCHERRLAAEKTVIEAKYEVAILAADVDSLDQKKHALQDTVKLWLADYFADPKADAGFDAEVEMREMKVREEKHQKPRRKDE